LENKQAGNKLFAEILILRSDVIFEIDFANGIWDEISASSMTIYAGRNLQIINLNIHTLNITEAPIFKANSDSFFILNDSGQPADLSNIFNYDSKLYQLRFDEASGTIYIQNIPGEDLSVAQTENEKGIQGIINEIADLRVLLNQMDSEGQRKALAGLSGVFFANIFKAAARSVESKFLFNKVNPEDEYDFWGNIFYGGLVLKNEDQLLGDFNSSWVNANIGRDLFVTDLIRLGAKISLDGINFKQDKNTANLFGGGPSIYAITKFYGMKIETMLGADFGFGKSKRNIDIGEGDRVQTLSPEADINYIALDFALNVDYTFDILDNVRMIPFMNFQKVQLNVPATTEKNGEAANLHFASQNIDKTITKAGMEFSFGEFDFIFSVGVFLGLDSSGDEKFKVNFDEIKDREIEIESDDSQEDFYGGRVGVNYRIANRFYINAYGGVELNDRLINYNLGIGACVSFF
jgi:hypothetical protein